MVEQVTLREGRWPFPNFMMPHISIGTTKSLKDIEYVTILDDIIILTMGEKNEVQYFKREKKKLDNFLVKTVSPLQALHTVCFSNAMSGFNNPRSVDYSRIRGVFLLFPFFNRALLRPVP